MNVIYEGEKYKVDLKDACIIKTIQLFLLIKRIVRLGRRVLNCFKPLSLVIILLLIYLIVVYFIGITIDEYHSFKWILWDSKELVFSSIIIVIALDFSSKERERKKKLKEQSWSLEMLTAQSEQFLIEISKCLNLKYEKSILISEELYNMFKEKMNIIHLPKDIIINKETLKEINLQIKYLENVYDTIIKNIKEDKYIMINNVNRGIYQNLKMACRQLKNSINKDYPPTQLKDDICHLSYQMLLSCAFLRRIWMWDYTSNQKIRTILLKYINKDNPEYKDYKITKWF